MVFGFLKKKKPKQADGTNPESVPEEKPSKKDKKSAKKEKESPQIQEKNDKQDKHDKHDKHEKHDKNSKQGTPTSKTSIQDADEDQWIYDSLVQFLQSPLWQTPILSFLEENCILFDNPKQEKPEFHDIHNDFKKLVRRLIEDIMNELEIAEEKFFEILQKGLQDHHYKKLFQQFYNADNYDLFKKIMFKKNKELELEAVQQLNEIDKKNTGHNAERLRHQNEADIQRLTIEKEEADLEHALALSLAMEEERQKLIAQEDEELEEAMRQSAIEYSSFQKKEREKIEHEKALQEKARLEEEREKENEKEKEKERQKLKQKEEELQKVLDIKRAVHYPETKRPPEEIEQSPNNKQAVAELQLSESKVIEEEEKIPHGERSGKKNKLEPLKNAPSTSRLSLEESTHSSIFPPLKGSLHYDPAKEQEREREQLERKPSKANIQDETLEERKKRLLAQRDLILAKKRADREAELRSYEAKRGNKVEIPKKTDSGVSKAEIERRKEIYDKLKLTS